MARFFDEPNDPFQTQFLDPFAQSGRGSLYDAYLSSPVRFSDDEYDAYGVPPQQNRPDMAFPNLGVNVSDDVLDPDPFGVKYADWAQRNNQTVDSSKAPFLDVMGKRMSRDELSRTEDGRKLLELADLNRSGTKRGFVEAVTEGSWWDFVPFMSMFASVGGSLMDAAAVSDVYSRMARGDNNVTDEERVKVALYEQQQRRNESGGIGAMVGDIARAAPAFVMEFLATGGLWSAGRAGITSMFKGSAKAMSHLAVNNVSREVAKQTAKREATKIIAEEAAKTATKSSVKYSSVMKSLWGGINKSENQALKETLEKSISEKLMPFFKRTIQGTSKCSDEVAEKAAKIAVDREIQNLYARNTGSAVSRFMSGASLWGKEQLARGILDYGTAEADSLIVSDSSLKYLGEAFNRLVPTALTRGGAQFAVGEAVRGAASLGFEAAGSKPLVDDTYLGIMQTAGYNKDEKLARDAWAIAAGSRFFEYVSENTGGGFGALLGAVNHKIMGKAAKDAATKALDNLLVGKAAQKGANAISRAIEMSVGTTEDFLKGHRAKATKAVFEALKDKGVTERAAKAFVESGAKDAAVLGPAAEQAITGMGGVKAFMKSAIKSAQSDVTNQLKYRTYAAYVVADMMANRGISASWLTDNFRRIGYDGLIEEMLEERYNDFAKGLFGLDPHADPTFSGRLQAAFKSAFLDPWKDGGKQLIAEAIGFSIPLVARHATIAVQRGALGGPSAFVAENARLASVIGQNGMGQVQMTAGNAYRTALGLHENLRAHAEEAANRVREAEAAIAANPETATMTGEQSVANIDMKRLKKAQADAEKKLADFEKDFNDQFNCTAEEAAARIAGTITGKLTFGGKEYDENEIVNVGDRLGSGDKGEARTQTSDEGAVQLSIMDQLVANAPRLGRDAAAMAEGETQPMNLLQRAVYRMAGAVGALATGDLSMAFRNPAKWRWRDYGNAGGYIDKLSNAYTRYQQNADVEAYREIAHMQGGTYELTDAEREDVFTAHTKSLGSAKSHEDVIADMRKAADDAAEAKEKAGKGSNLSAAERTAAYESALRAVGINVSYQDYLNGLRKAEADELARRNRPENLSRTMTDEEKQQVIDRHRAKAEEAYEADAGKIARAYFAVHGARTFRDDEISSAAIAAYVRENHIVYGEDVEVNGKKVNYADVSAIENAMKTDSELADAIQANKLDITKRILASISGINTEDQKVSTILDSEQDKIAHILLSVSETDPLHNLALEDAMVGLAGMTGAHVVTHLTPKQAGFDGAKAATPVAASRSVRSSHVRRVASVATFDRATGELKINLENLTDRDEAFIRSVANELGITLDNFTGDRLDELKTNIIRLCHQMTLAQDITKVSLEFKYDGDKAVTVRREPVGDASHRYTYTDPRTGKTVVGIHATDEEFVATHASEFNGLEPMDFEFTIASSREVQSESLAAIISYAGLAKDYIQAIADAYHFSFDGRNASGELLGYALPAFQMVKDPATGKNVPRYTPEEAEAETQRIKRLADLYANLIGSKGETPAEEVLVKAFTFAKGDKEDLVKRRIEEARRCYRFMYGDPEHNIPGTWTLAERVARKAGIKLPGDRKSFSGLFGTGSYSYRDMTRFTGGNFQFAIDFESNPDYRDSILYTILRKGVVSNLDLFYKTAPTQEEIDKAKAAGLRPVPHLGPLYLPMRDFARRCYRTLSNWADRADEDGRSEKAAAYRDVMARIFSLELNPTMEPSLDTISYLLEGVALGGGTRRAQSAIATRADKALAELTEFMKNSKEYPIVYGAADLLLGGSGLWNVIPDRSSNTSDTAVELTGAAAVLDRFGFYRNESGVTVSDQLMPEQFRNKPTEFRDAVVQAVQTAIQDEKDRTDLAKRLATADLGPTATSALSTISSIIVNNSSDRTAGIVKLMDVLSTVMKAAGADPSATDSLADYVQDIVSDHAGAKKAVRDVADLKQRNDELVQQRDQAAASLTQAQAELKKAQDELALANQAVATAQADATAAQGAVELLRGNPDIVAQMKTVLENTAMANMNVTETTQPEDVADSVQGDIDMIADAQPELYAQMASLFSGGVKLSVGQYVVDVSVASGKMKVESVSVGEAPVPSATADQERLAAEASARAEAAAEAARQAALADKLAKEAAAREAAARGDVLNVNDQLAKNKRERDAVAIDIAQTVMAEPDLIDTAFHDIFKTPKASKMAESVRGGKANVLSLANLVSSRLEALRRAAKANETKADVEGGNVGQTEVKQEESEQEETPSVPEINSNSLEEFNANSDFDPDLYHISIDRDPTSDCGDVDGSVLPNAVSALRGIMDAGLFGATAPKSKSEFLMAADRLIPIVFPNLSENDRFRILAFARQDWGDDETKPAGLFTMETHMLAPSPELDDEDRVSAYSNFSFDEVEALSPFAKMMTVVDPTIYGSYQQFADQLRTRFPAVLDRVSREVEPLRAEADTARLAHEKAVAEVDALREQLKTAAPGFEYAQIKATLDAKSAESSELLNKHVEALERLSKAEGQVESAKRLVAAVNPRMNSFGKTQMEHTAASFAAIEDILDHPTRYLELLSGDRLATVAFATLSRMRRSSARKMLATMGSITQMQSVGVTQDAYDPVARSIGNEDSETHGDQAPRLRTNLTRNSLLNPSVFASLLYGNLAETVCSDPGKSPEDVLKDVDRRLEGLVDALNDFVSCLDSKGKFDRELNDDNTEIASIGEEYSSAKPRVGANELRRALPKFKRYLRRLAAVLREHLGDNPFCEVLESEAMFRDLDRQLDADPYVQGRIVSVLFQAFGSTIDRTGLSTERRADRPNDYNNLAIRRLIEAIEKYRSALKDSGEKVGDQYSPRQRFLDASTASSRYSALRETAIMVFAPLFEQGTVAGVPITTSDAGSGVGVTWLSLFQAHRRAMPRTTERADSGTGDKGGKVAMSSRGPISAVVRWSARDDKDNPMSFRNLLRGVLFAETNLGETDVNDVLMARAGEIGVEQGLLRRVETVGQDGASVVEFVDGDGKALTPKSAEDLLVSYSMQTMCWPDVRRTPILARSTATAVTPTQNVDLCIRNLREAMMADAPTGRGLATDNLRFARFQLYSGEHSGTNFINIPIVRMKVAKNDVAADGTATGGTRSLQVIRRKKAGEYRKYISDEATSWGVMLGNKQGGAYARIRYKDADGNPQERWDDPDNAGPDAFFVNYAPQTSTEKGIADSGEQLSLKNTFSDFEDLFKMMYRDLMIATDVKSLGKDLKRSAISNASGLTSPLIGYDLNSGKSGKARIHLVHTSTKGMANAAGSLFTKDASGFYHLSSKGLEAAVGEAKDRNEAWLGTTMSFGYGANLLRGLSPNDKYTLLKPHILNYGDSPLSFFKTATMCWKQGDDEYGEGTDKRVITDYIRGKYWNPNTGAENDSARLDTDIFTDADSYKVGALSSGNFKIRLSLQTVGQDGNPTTETADFSLLDFITGVMYKDFVDAVKSKTAATSSTGTSRKSAKLSSKEVKDILLHYFHDLNGDGVERPAGVTLSFMDRTSGNNDFREITHSKDFVKLIDTLVKGLQIGIIDDAGPDEDDVVDNVFDISYDISDMAYMPVANIARGSEIEHGNNQTNYTIDAINLAQDFLSTRMGGANAPTSLTAAEHILRQFCAWSALATGVSVSQEALLSDLQDDPRVSQALSAGDVDGSPTMDDIAMAVALKHLKKGLLTPMEGIHAGQVSCGARLEFQGKRPEYGRDEIDPLEGKPVGVIDRNTDPTHRDIHRGSWCFAADERRFWGANRRLDLAEVNVADSSFRYGWFLRDDVSAFLSVGVKTGDETVDSAISDYLKNTVASDLSRTVPDFNLSTGKLTEGQVVVALERMFTDLREAQLSLGSGDPATAKAAKVKCRALREIIGSLFVDHHGNDVSVVKVLDRNGRPVRMIEAVSFDDLFVKSTAVDENNNPVTDMKFDRTAVYTGEDKVRLASNDESQPGSATKSYTSRIFLAGTSFGLPRTPSYNGSNWLQVVRASLPVTEKSAQLSRPGSLNDIVFQVGTDALCSPSPNTLAILGCDHDGDETHLYFMRPNMESDGLCDEADLSEDILRALGITNLKALGNLDEVTASSADQRNAIELAISRDWAYRDERTGRIVLRKEFKRMVSNSYTRDLFSMARDLLTPDTGKDEAHARQLRKPNGRVMFYDPDAAQCNNVHAVPLSNEARWAKLVKEECAPAIVVPELGLDITDPRTAAAAATSALQTDEARGNIVNTASLVYMAMNSGLFNRGSGTRFGLFGPSALGGYSQDTNSYVDPRVISTFMHYFDGLSNMTFDDIKAQICSRLNLTPDTIDILVVDMLSHEVQVGDRRVIMLPTTDDEMEDVMRTFIRSARYADAKGVKKFENDDSPLPSDDWSRFFMGKVVHRDTLERESSWQRRLDEGLFGRQADEEFYSISQEERLCRLMKAIGLQFADNGAVEQADADDKTGVATALMSEFTPNELADLLNRMTGMAGRNYYSAKLFAALSTALKDNAAPTTLKSLGSLQADGASIPSAAFSAGRLAEQMHEFSKFAKTMISWETAKDACAGIRHAKANPTNPSAAGNRADARRALQSALAEMRQTSGDGYRLSDRQCEYIGLQNLATDVAYTGLPPARGPKRYLAGRAVGFIENREDRPYDTASKALGDSVPAGGAGVYGAFATGYEDARSVATRRDGRDPEANLHHMDQTPYAIAALMDPDIAGTPEQRAFLTALSHSCIFQLDPAMSKRTGKEVRGRNGLRRWNVATGRSFLGSGGFSNKDVLSIVKGEHQSVQVNYLAPNGSGRQLSNFIASAYALVSAFVKSSNNADGFLGFLHFGVTDDVSAADWLGGAFALKLVPMASTGSLEYQNLIGRTFDAVANGQLDGAARTPVLSFAAEYRGKGQNQDQIGPTSYDLSMENLARFIAEMRVTKFDDAFSGDKAPHLNQLMRAAVTCYTGLKAVHGSGIDFDLVDKAFANMFAPIGATMYAQRKKVLDERVKAFADAYSAIANHVSIAPSQLVRQLLPVYGVMNERTNSAPSPDSYSSSIINVIPGMFNRLSGRLAGARLAYSKYASENRSRTAILDAGDGKTREVQVDFTNVPSPIDAATALHFSGANVKSIQNQLFRDWKSELKDSANEDKLRYSAGVAAEKIVRAAVRGGDVMSVLIPSAVDANAGNADATTGVYEKRPDGSLRTGVPAGEMADGRFVDLFANDNLLMKAADAANPGTVFRAAPSSWTHDQEGIYSYIFGSRVGEEKDRAYGYASGKFDADQMILKTNAVCDKLASTFAHIPGVKVTPVTETDPDGKRHVTALELRFDMQVNDDVEFVETKRLKMERKLAKSKRKILVQTGSGVESVDVSQVKSVIRVDFATPNSRASKKIDVNSYAAMTSLVAELNRKNLMDITVAEVMMLTEKEREELVESLHPNIEGYSSQSPRWSLDTNGLLTLVSGVTLNTSDERTVYHEYFHAMMGMLRACGMFSEKDGKDLAAIFGKPTVKGTLFNEERAADDFAKWVIALREGEFGTGTDDKGVQGSMFSDADVNAASRFGKMRARMLGKGNAREHKAWVFFQRVYNFISNLIRNLVGNFSYAEGFTYRDATGARHLTGRQILFNAVLRGTVIDSNANSSMHAAWLSMANRAATADEAAAPRSEDTSANRRVGYESADADKQPLSHEFSNQIAHMKLGNTYGSAHMVGLAIHNLARYRRGLAVDPAEVRLGEDEKSAIDTAWHAMDPAQGVMFKIGVNLPAEAAVKQTMMETGGLVGKLLRDKWAGLTAEEKGSILTTFVPDRAAVRSFERDYNKRLRIRATSSDVRFLSLIHGMTANPALSGLGGAAFVKEAMRHCARTNVDEVMSRVVEDALTELSAMFDAPLGELSHTTVLMRATDGTVYTGGIPGVDVASYKSALETYGPGVDMKGESSDAERKARVSDILYTIASRYYDLLDTARSVKVNTGTANDPNNFKKFASAADVVSGVLIAAGTPITAYANKQLDEMERIHAEAMAAGNERLAKAVAHVISNVRWFATQEIAGSLNGEGGMTRANVFSGIVLSGDVRSPFHGTPEYRFSDNGISGHEETARTLRAAYPLTSPAMQHVLALADRTFAVVQAAKKYADLVGDGVDRHDSPFGDDIVPLSPARPNTYADLFGFPDGQKPAAPLSPVEVMEMLGYTSEDVMSGNYNLMDAVGSTKLLLTMPDRWFAEQLPYNFGSVKGIREMMSTESDILSGLIQKCVMLQNWYEDLLGLSREPGRPLLEMIKGETNLAFDNGVYLDSATRSYVKFDRNHHFGRGVHTSIVFSEDDQRIVDFWLKSIKARVSGQRTIVTGATGLRFRMEDLLGRRTPLDAMNGETYPYDVRGRNSRSWAYDLDARKVREWMERNEIRLRSTDDSAPLQSSGYFPTLLNYISALPADVAFGNIIPRKFTSEGEPVRSGGVYDRLITVIDSAMRDAAVERSNRIKAKHNINVMSERDLNDIVLGEIVKAGLAIAQRDADGHIASVTLTVPIDDVETTFKDGPTYQKLIDAGRTPEMLDAGKIGEDCLRAWNEVVDYANKFQWMRNGLGKSLNRFGTMLPFFCGSGVFQHLAKQVERPDFAFIPNNLKRYAETYREMIAAEIDKNGNRVVRGATQSQIDWVAELFNLPDNGLQLRDAIKNGEYAPGSAKAVMTGFSATEADVNDSARLGELIYLRVAENTWKDDYNRRNGGALLRNRILARAIMEEWESSRGSSYVTGEAGLNDEQMYELYGQLPANMSILHHVRTAVEELGRTIQFRNTFVNFAFTKMDGEYDDPEGRPICYIRPADIPAGTPSEAVDGIPDDVWEGLARWWLRTSNIKGIEYDTYLTGRENAQRVYDAIHLNVSDSGNGKLVNGHRFEALPDEDVSRVPTIGACMVRTDDAQDDDVNARAGTFWSKGEAYGYAKMLFSIPGTSGQGGVAAMLRNVMAYSKSASVAFSFFFQIATVFESQAAAVGFIPTALSIANRSKDMNSDAAKAVFEKLAKLPMFKGLSALTDGHFTGYKDIMQMLDTNDPFIQDIVQICNEIGMPLSFRASNPIEPDKARIEQDIHRLVEYVRREYGEKKAANVDAFARGVLVNSGEVAFNKTLNSVKIALALQISQKLRVAAKKEGRSFNFRRELRKVAPYVNAEIGGVHPFRYAWASRRFRSYMNIGMFSWEWTKGAWVAGGGEVLEDLFLGGHSTNPWLRQQLWGRWMRMYGIVFLGVPAAAQFACKALALALGGDDDDDDPWFIWNNEEKAQDSYSINLTPLLKALNKEDSWWGRTAGVAWRAAQGIPVLGNFVPGYTGNDPRNTTKDRKMYIHFGKQGTEFMRWFNQPVEQLASKLSMPLQRMEELMFGFNVASPEYRETSEDDMPFLERVLSPGSHSNLFTLLKAFVPFSYNSLTDLQDAGILATLAPATYGVSKTATEKRLEAALRSWAENDKGSYNYGGRLKGDPKTRNANVGDIPMILREAKANGLDNAMLLSQATGSLARSYYQELFKLLPTSFADRDFDARRFAEIARKLNRLGIKQKSALASINQRFKNLSEEWKKRLPKDSKRVREAALDMAMRDPYSFETKWNARSGSRVGDVGLRQDAKGDDSASFLATDEVPETIFGIPVVTRDYTEEDLAFFQENPKAAGYYQNDDDPDPDDDPGGGSPTVEQAGWAAGFSKGVLSAGKSAAVDLVEDFELFMPEAKEVDGVVLGGYRQNNIAGEPIELGRTFTRAEARTNARKNMDQGLEALYNLNPAAAKYYDLGAVARIADTTFHHGRNWTEKPRFAELVAKIQSAESEEEYVELNNAIASAYIANLDQASEGYASRKNIGDAYFNTFSGVGTLGDKTKLKHKGNINWTH